MRLAPAQLAAALKRGLAAAYLVSGEEPLLRDEAADAVRAAARAAGFADRQVFFADRHFAWDELRQSTGSLSLFADRRLFEVRLPSGKPDKGATVLAALAARPPPDIVTLVLTEKLDRKAAEVPWVRAFETHGVWVSVRPVEIAALPGWLRSRAADMQVVLEPEAAELIAQRVEGNLLAAKQELEKLVLLAGGAPIGNALVLGAVGDSARYDVFQLGAAAAAGDAARALRILLSLQSEGVEPTLVLWALAREVRGLYQAAERKRLHGGGRSDGSGRSEGGARGEGGARSGWNLASVPEPRALSRLDRLPLGSLLAEAGRTDRIIKGLAPGDAWTAVTALTARLAGALQPDRLSGRVAR